MPASVKSSLPGDEGRPETHAMSMPLARAVDWLAIGLGTVQSAEP
jgi:hypothetical protein